MQRTATGAKAARGAALRRREAQTIVAQAPFQEAASGYLAKAAICISL